MAQNDEFHGDIPQLFELLSIFKTAGGSVKVSMPESHPELHPCIYPYPVWGAHYFD
jgi:hypothetical protein